ncbi:hypothetical protein DA2_1039 [Desulfovibrio sp. A2]|nr:hypothetical protein DA2_1039 [Desulfovibrio sp. A2]
MVSRVRHDSFLRASCWRGVRHRVKSPIRIWGRSTSLAADGPIVNPIS